MNKSKEEIIESEYASPQMFNMIYNFMLMNQLKDIYLPFMDAMKEYFIKIEEFEKCENVKNFINLLLEKKNNK